MNNFHYIFKQSYIMNRLVARSETDQKRKEQHSYEC